jgi:hypothetical protein
MNFFILNGPASLMNAGGMRWHSWREMTYEAGGLELAAVQLGHKRMTTTDEHYNERDMGMI